MNEKQRKEQTEQINPASPTDKKSASERIIANILILLVQNLLSKKMEKQRIGLPVET